MPPPIQGQAAACDSSPPGPHRPKGWSHSWSSLDPGKHLARAGGSKAGLSSRSCPVLCHTHRLYLWTAVALRGHMSPGATLGYPCRGPGTTVSLSKASTRNDKTRRTDARAAGTHRAVAWATESLEVLRLPRPISPIVTASGRLRRLPESPGLLGDKAKR